MVVADRAALIEWYQTQLAYSRERAEASAWSTGRAIRDRTGNYIVTRLDGFGRQGPDRIAVVRHAAHELTHIARRVVKQCPDAVPSWIIEGWAEWAAFRVVDLAGLRSYGQMRAERLEVIKRAWDRALFPTLVQLDREQWARLTQSRGSAATYGLALLAVERLIGRVGSHEALDTYCQSVRAHGRWAAFERIFGISEPDFAMEFMRVVRELLGS